MAKLHWNDAMRHAIDHAQALHEDGAHKQLVNRLLEPFSHITVVCTSTNWSNFLHLRDHADAEPHIRILAQEVRKALEGATPQVLYPGDWHLPFVNVTDEHGVEPLALSGGEALQNAIKLSVARCASTSYKTVDGFDMTIERAVELHDKLVAQDPLHASPCEHQCSPDQLDCTTGQYEHPEKHGNLRGFVQYRKTLSGERR